ncbi:MAG: hypothetical protein ACRYFS_18640 [Janthinobacterium lividum]
MNSFFSKGRKSPLCIVPIRIAPQNWGGGAFLTLFLLMPGIAQAKDAAPTTPGVTRVQTQAFQLGYALRVADLRAVAYTKSIEALKEVSDTQLAGAEIAHFSDDVPQFRRTQASSYARTAALLNQMGAPQSMRLWAVQSAAMLNAPLVYSKDAQKLAKTEPDTAAVLAELVEIQAIKADAVRQQTPMTLWLEITGGKVTPWTADVGAYTAELSRVSHAITPSPIASVTARLLLLNAPTGAPAATRESLATLIPSGGGNLQNLATMAPSSITSGKITHVYETLLTIYNAEAQAETLGKGAA